MLFAFHFREIDFERVAEIRSPLSYNRVETEFEREVVGAWPFFKDQIIGLKTFRRVNSHFPIFMRFICIVRERESQFGISAYFGRPDSVVYFSRGFSFREFIVSRRA